ERSEVAAGRPDDTRYALLERRPHVLRDGVGGGEVDRCVESGHVDRVADLEPPHLVSRGLERGNKRPAYLPVAAEERNLHAAARRSSSGLTRSTAARKRFSSGPTPDTESRSGRSSNEASSPIASASTASISAMIRSKPSSSVSVTTDLPSRVIRFEVDSIESMIRPFRFSFARSSSRGRRLPAAISAICSAQISRQAATFSS